MGLVVAIANQKGGVGKTTTAVNLAHALTFADRNVLLVDFDPQANATSGLGAQLENIPTQDHYLISSGAVAHCDATRIPKLSLLPASPSLHAVGKILAAAPDKEFRLKHALAVHSQAFDFTLIDCPPSMSLFTSNALVAADAVLVPLQCEYFAMEGLAQMMGIIRATRKGLNPALEIYGILLTMFDASLDINRDVGSEVRKHFENETFETMISRDVMLAEASSYAKSIFEYAPRCRAAFDYACLAREVLSGPRKEAGTRV